MKCAATLSLLAVLASAASAQSRVFGLWVNGIFQGDGRSTYIRTPHTNSPIKDISSADIICNAVNVVASNNVYVNSGDTVDFEWYKDTRGDEIFPSSRKGAVDVYIAPAASNGYGNVWTKLAESGFNSGKWATDDLKTNGNRHSVAIPKSLAPGDYLLRAEIIALDKADTAFTADPSRGAEFFVSCAQISIVNGGKTIPTNGFNFLEGLKKDVRGIIFDIKNALNGLRYKNPGPEIWDGISGYNPEPTMKTIYVMPIVTIIEPTKTASGSQPTATPALTTATSSRVPRSRRRPSRL